jgi:hypothetical protein
MNGAHDIDTISCCAYYTRTTAEYITSFEDLWVARVLARLDFIILALTYVRLRVTCDMHILTLSWYGVLCAACKRRFSRGRYSVHVVIQAGIYTFTRGIPCSNFDACTRMYVMYHMSFVQARHFRRSLVIFRVYGVTRSACRVSTTPTQFIHVRTVLYAVVSSIQKRTQRENKINNSRREYDPILSNSQSVSPIRGPGGGVGWQTICFSEISYVHMTNR